MKISRWGWVIFSFLLLLGLFLFFKSDIFLLPNSRSGQQIFNALAPESSAPVMVERSVLADRLNVTDSTIQEDIQIVSELFTQYRLIFKGAPSQNPIGDNREITAALTGKNRMRLAIVPPNHPAISSDGELIDRWGTPFFFHALAADNMEIRSAGPDQKMWTADDVLSSSE